MIITRRQLRRIIKEALALSPEFYDEAIENAIKESEFWLEDNTEEEAYYEEIEGFGDVFQNPAAERLQLYLQNAVTSVGSDVSIIVQTPELDVNPSFLLSGDKPQYPDSVISGGYATIDDHNNPVVMINLAQYDNTYDPNDVNIERLVTKGAGVVRHELVHLAQIQKRAESEGISLADALEKYRKEGVVPPESAPRQDHIDSYIEIDAHALQAASELVSLYGKEEALRLISREPDLEQKLGANLPYAVEDYILKNPSKETENKFRKKVYKHIMDITHKSSTPDSI